MRRMKRLPKVTWQLQAFVSVFLWESLLPGSLQLPLIISATSHQADSSPSEDEGVLVTLAWHRSCSSMGLQAPCSASMQLMVLPFSTEVQVQLSFTEKLGCTFPY